MRPRCQASSHAVVRLPGERVEARVERRGGRVREVVQQVMRELAPADLAHEAVRRRLCGRARGDGVARGRDALARADLAEVQVRRQARGPGPVGPIAPLAVARDGRRPRRLSSCASAPASPGVQAVVQARVPADARQQAEFSRARRLDGGAGGAVIACGAGDSGCGSASRRAAQVAPERREHAVRIALAGAHFPRLVQQRGVEALALEPVLAQRRLDARVVRDARRVVEAVPVHRRAAPALARHGGASPRVNRRDAGSAARRGRAVSASRRARLWCSHQRLAAPGAHSPSSSGACT